MLLISTAITRKLDFQEFGGRKIVRETRDDGGGEPSILLCTQNTCWKVDEGVSFFLNQILFGYFIVFLSKGRTISHPP